MPTLKKRSKVTAPLFFVSERLSLMRYHSRASELRSRAGSNRQADTRTDRQADRHADRQTNARIDRQAVTRTGRQADRHTDRQTDGHTDRQTRKPDAPSQRPQSMMADTGEFLVRCCTAVPHSSSCASYEYPEIAPSTYVCGRAALDVNRRGKQPLSIESYE